MVCQRPHLCQHRLVGLTLWLVVDRPLLEAARDGIRGREQDRSRHSEAHPQTRTRSDPLHRQGGTVKSPKHETLSEGGKDGRFGRLKSP